MCYAENVWMYILEARGMEHVFNVYSMWMTSWRGPLSAEVIIARSFWPWFTQAKQVTFSGVC